jgi:predicted TIM-barrel fold metal-dependent hydrolase
MVHAMIIDSHVHVGKNPRFQGDAEEIILWADKLGFDRVFCSHIGAIKHDYPECNRETAKAVQRYPDRILGYVVIPTPYFGQAAVEELQRGIEVDGMRGLKIYSQPGADLASGVLYSIDNPLMDPLLEKAADFKCPILAHATPQECEGVSQRVPEAILIMAHSGGQPAAFGDWHMAMEAARKYPNIYLDTASSMADMGYIEAAVEAVGPERVIFGTDMPLLEPFSQLAKVTTAEISQEAKELILGGNMARLLGLGR